VTIRWCAWRPICHRDSTPFASVSATVTGAVPAQDAAGRVVGDEATVGQVEVLPPAQTTGWDGRGITVGALEVELTQSPGPATPGHNLTVSLRWHRTNQRNARHYRNAKTQP